MRTILIDRGNRLLDMEYLGGQVRLTLDGRVGEVGVGDELTTVRYGVWVVTRIEPRPEWQTGRFSVLAQLKEESEVRST